MRNTKFTYPGSSRLIVFFGSVVWFPVYKCRGCLQKTFTKIRRISSRYSWFCLVPWMSCLQKHTEFVRRKKNFTLNWCSLVARVSCLQINLNWESSSFSLVYWYLQNNIPRTNSDCQNTALPAIFDFCFRL